jgi:DNA-binding MarR family transcriptional regulator
MDEPGCGPDHLPRMLTEELLDLGAAIDLIGHAAAARLGVNQTDLICLNMLHRHGPMGAGDLAAALGLTTAAISAMATRLEKGGYAHRQMDPSDRRRVLLHADPAGIQQAFGLFDQLYAATTGLYASQPEAELRAILDLLRRFRQVITESTGAIRVGEGTATPVPPAAEP